MEQTGASSLIYGCMGLGGGWNNHALTKGDLAQAHQVVDAALAHGIQRFDHADIYTFGKAETVFGQLLQQRPELRDQIQIQSKCGIRFADDQGPKRYDFSAQWIASSVEGILSRLQIEQLDCLLLHRPDPLMVVDEVAEVIHRLQRQGKIRQLGVSNMNAGQIASLQSALDTPIVSNQLEISLSQLDWLEQGITPAAYSSLGTLEYCQQQQIQIQSWGSLSQGLFSGRDLANAEASVQQTAAIVQQLAAHYQVSCEAIILGWLQRHPAHIQPVIGSTNISRIAACAEVAKVSLSREHWYALYQAARGQELP